MIIFQKILALSTLTVNAKIINYNYICNCIIYSVENLMLNTLLSIHWFLVTAIWCGVNGILHDIFILREHKGPYDRELLRLLMDGHVLILSGIILFICWNLVKVNPFYAALTGIVVALAMIVYCLMIFPFLKSFVTLGISLVLTLVCVRIFLQMR